MLQVKVCPNCEEPIQYYATTDCPECGHYLGKMIECPQCGIFTKSIATHCPECGNNLVKTEWWFWPFIIVVVVFMSLYIVDWIGGFLGLSIR